MECGGQTPTQQDSTRPPSSTRLSSYASRGKLPRQKKTRGSHAQSEPTASSVAKSQKISRLTPDKNSVVCPIILCSRRDFPGRLPNSQTPAAPQARRPPG